MTKPGKIGWWGAAALVVANMIGTGVFTSLGFQLPAIQNSWSIIFLWSIGGVIALTGAFCYAELGAYFKRSGGEYHFLSELYHPVVGYLAGWVSLTVGFAAPVALSAMAMGVYIQRMTDVAPKISAILAVVITSFIHSFSIRQSSRFQNAVTLLKLILIFGFIIAGLVIYSDYSALEWSGSWRREIIMPAFAVSLVFVTYSYSGWNAAAYIVEEIENPEKHLPKGLINGTLIVMILYILLQYVFLRNASLDQLCGKIEIGQVVAYNLFGVSGGDLISSAIALFLLSSVSAMIWVGPRVSQVMGEDYAIWRFLQHKNKQGIPVKAVWFQSAVSILMIATGTFEQILVYCGFILQLFCALTVGGTFKLHRSIGDLPYRSPMYPWPAVIFLSVSGWILIFLLSDRPVESAIGSIILIVGVFTYGLNSRLVITKRGEDSLF